MCGLFALGGWVLAVSSLLPLSMGLIQLRGDEGHGAPCPYGGYVN